MRKQDNNQDWLATDDNNDKTINEWQQTHSRQCVCQPVAPTPKGQQQTCINPFIFQYQPTTITKPLGGKPVRESNRQGVTTHKGETHSHGDKNELWGPINDTHIPNNNSLSLIDDANKDDNTIGQAVYCHRGWPWRRSHPFLPKENPTVLELTSKLTH